MTKRRSGARRRPGAWRGPREGRSPATKVFLAFLAMIAFAYLALITYHTSVPRRSTRAEETFGYLERCRELCLQYGLIPTGDVAADAKSYLVAARDDGNQNPSGEPSGDEAGRLSAGATAPEFELSDADGRKVSLSQLRQQGSVLVVFYYGYFCSHCVAQLFALEQDLSKFQEKGVYLVALSADPPSETAEKFRRYGRFHFPVLSDPENRVAERYGVFRRAEKGREEDRKHGTFLVDRNGTIRWAYSGYRPFINNESLLRIATIFEKQPRSKSVRGQSGNQSSTTQRGQAVSQSPQISQTRAASTRGDRSGGNEL